MIATASASADDAPTDGTQSEVAPTAEDIRRWPATVDPVTAGTAFGISRSYAYQLVKQGDFPAKVIRVGGKNRVVTADLMRVLGITGTHGSGPDGTHPALSVVGGDDAS
ncbi:helix-turn-helix transcriptional regulator [Actinomadura sp. 3N508]